ncbi:MAG: TOBE-like domain-containing protein [Hyphomonadaceae bacterium]|nr:TOBE-like domain-containing protein [Hyphomonadaceae bacterium]
MTLAISDIAKNYGRFPALKSVSLFAEDGEFLALLGPSGSGKTTLLRVIAGLEVPDSGTIQFRGENLLAKPVRERNIGFVFQHYALFRHMTAAQNIAFGLRAKPRSTRPPEAAIRSKVDELLSLVQLEGLGARYPAQLSGGQRQRVALARALAIEPRILLLDEPFGALDAKVRRGLRRWLRDLHERTGLTTIFVTHDQEEALELADRVALLKDGALEQMGTPEELYHSPESAFVFEFLGDCIKLPCIVEGGIAIVSGAGVPIVGARPPQNGPATAHIRPDAFNVTVGGGQGLSARVRNVLLAGPDARIECVLDSGDAIEVRIAHENADRIAPRDRVTLAPRAVRVWQSSSIA